jgi:adenylate kinase family enzyme
MTTREDYLEGAFQNDQRQLQRINDIIEEASQLFGRVVIDDEWPYDLEDGKPISGRKNTEHEGYSQSTNAMILFALVAAARKIAPRSPLLPNIHRGEPIDFKDSWTIFERVWHKLAIETKVEFKKKKKLHITYSDSFGREDPFTLTWILEIDRARVFKKNLMPAEVRKALRKLASNRVRQIFETHNFICSKDRKGYSWLSWENKAKKRIGKADKQSKIKVSTDHAFPALRYVQLYKCLKEDRSIRTSLSTVKLQSYFENRMHEQLSKNEIRDGSFDASELVFALEGLLQLEPDSVSQTLLDRIFQVIAESQNRNPYWRPVKPFVASPQGIVLFPLSVETACSLLRCCQLIEVNQKDPQCFSQNVDLFQRYSDWLLSRLKRGAVKKPDKGIVNFTGWHSEHVHIHPGIHLWETSQVMLFLIYYSTMLDRHVARQSLLSSHLFEEQPWDDKQKFWHIQYWSKEKRIKEPLAGLRNSPLQAHRHALRYIVAPRPSPQIQIGGYTNNTTLKSDQRSNMQYSMLLYGPPGTGKTSFAEEICKALRWPLITITPSDFIRGGESQVEARAKRIFEVLEAQSEVVILFDEIDRMILDRESEKYTDQSDIFQFMTPSMLTKLRNLRKKKRVIFLVATNYAERIDKAVKRRGRLDAHILLPPPDIPGRIEIFKQLISERIENRTRRKAFEKVAAQKLMSIVKRTRLMVFVELKELVDKATKSLGEKDRTNTNKIIAALKKNINNADRSNISLLSYKGRFDDNEKIPQKPYREFLVLLYLCLEEKGKLRKEEESVLAKALGNLSGINITNWKKMDSVMKDKVKTAIQKELIQDTKLVNVIIKNLKL